MESEILEQPEELQQNTGPDSKIVSKEAAMDVDGHNVEDAKSLESTIATPVDVSTGEIEFPSNETSLHVEATPMVTLQESAQLDSAAPTSVDVSTEETDFPSNETSLHVETTPIIALQESAQLESASPTSVDVNTEEAELPKNEPTMQLDTPFIVALPDPLPQDSGPVREIDRESTPVEAVDITTEESQPTIETESQKRPREDDQVELPAAKIQSLEDTPATTESVIPAQEQTESKEKEQEEIVTEEAFVPSSLPVADSVLQLSEATDSTADLKPSFDTKSITSSGPSVIEPHAATKTTKERQPSHEPMDDNSSTTHLPGETAGYETHSDIMNLCATRMMPKLQMRSMELDSVREHVREWLCVLQPSLATQLRERPWSDIHRLFVRMLEANRSSL